MADRDDGSNRPKFKERVAHDTDWIATGRLLAIAGALLAALGTGLSGWTLHTVVDQGQAISGLTTWQTQYEQAAADRRATINRRIDSVEANAAKAVDDLDRRTGKRLDDLNSWLRDLEASRSYPKGK